MSELFVNYRRSDAAWAAGRIGDRLRSAFGNERVFLDTLAIEPGEDFVEVIGERVEQCRVLLSIIGSNWLGEMNARASHSNDYVKIEISQALSRGIRVVPILIDDVTVPAAGDLPADIRSLSRLNAARIRSEAFESDIGQFISFLSNFLNSEQTQTLAQPTPETSNAAAGDVKIKHRTEYWKIGKDGRPRHRIFISIDAPDPLVSTISRVVYRLHPSFKNPVREIIDRRNNFELQTNGWGEFEVKADIYFDMSATPVTCRHLITFNE